MTHLKGEKVTSISYKNIAKVKMRPGVLLVSGYFYFERVGHNHYCGLIGAAQDKDCIVFRSFENETARKIKKYLKSKI